MIDIMLICLCSWMCVCALHDFIYGFWLANGVVPCCRLCRLGYCRVIQAGRYVEGSVHWGYTRGWVFVYVKFCGTQHLYKL